LLVLGVRRPIALQPGVLIAFEDPRSSNAMLLVKRVVRTFRSGIEVWGDNPESSTDSRSFGLVPHRRVVGVVVYRYGPPSRAGFLVRSAWVPGGLKAP